MFAINDVYMNMNVIMCVLYIEYNVYIYIHEYFFQYSVFISCVHLVGQDGFKKIVSFALIVNFGKRTTSGKESNIQCIHW